VLMVTKNVGGCLGLGERYYATHQKCLMYGGYPISSTVHHSSCTGAERIFRSICTSRVSQSVCRDILSHSTQSLVEVIFCSTLFIIPAAEAVLVFRMVTARLSCDSAQKRDGRELKWEQTYGVSGM
jgi:hypothetical protein